MYVSLLPDSRIEKIQKNPVDGPAGKAGSVLVVDFTLAGQRFMALDGGPIFQFNEATSFYIECQDQKEVDYFWNKLSAVPESEQCGWCKDKYGLSWQIIPTRLGELMGDPDPVKSKRVINAMLKMHKINIADLEQAYQQEA